MKNIFILLFPQKEYTKGYFTEKDISMFNECIRKRYIEKEYDFCVAAFKDSDLGISSILPSKIVYADITFECSSPYTCKDWRYPDFKMLAEKISANKYHKIIMGGFHCFDCVQKLAKEIYTINHNVIIDTDLTEMFRNAYLYEDGFCFEKFNPELKLKRVLSKDDYTPSGILSQMIKRYKNPIWGISDECIRKLEEKIKVQIEDEREVLNK